LAVELVDTFVNARFGNEERHRRRVEKVKALDQV
jgi:ribose 5-phosphate isomerase RpiB